MLSLWVVRWMQGSDECITAEDAGEFAYAAEAKAFAYAVSS